MFLDEKLQDKGHALKSCHRRYPAAAALKAVLNGTGALLGSPHRSMAALLGARVLAAFRIQTEIWDPAANWLVPSLMSRYQPVFG